MSNIDEAARAIREVYAGGSPIAPLRDLFDDPDIATAYAIQETNTKVWLKEGAKLSGRKIGLTSKAVQQQLGVDQPDYGMLFDTMAVESGEEVDAASVCQPRIEGEIAFILGRDLLSEEPTRAELENSIEYASPAFEIVGSRIKDWNIRIFDTIADNASSGKYALGHDRKKLGAFDLLNCEMALESDGDVVSTGKGSACLGDPLNAALWLAKTMTSAHRPLVAGDIILSGALGPFVPVEAGRTYDLKIAGLGSVRTTFV